MRRARRTALAAVLLLLATASAAGADDQVEQYLEMKDFHLVGSVDWHADNDFAFAWGSVPEAETLAYRWLEVPWDTAVHRRSNIGSIPLPVPATGGAPPPPALYRAEMWLESPSHATRGPARIAFVPLDASSPPPPAPVGPPAWVWDREPITVTIGHSPIASPSGVAGYAISLTPVPDEPPCAAVVRCAKAEVDLPGIDNDVVRLGPLPEGVDYLHVATVSGAGVPSETRSVPIRIDASAPRIRFAGLPASWVDHPVPITALADDPQSGSVAAGPGGPFTALAIDGGVPTTASGGEVAAVVAGEGVHRLSGWGRDAVGNVGGPRSAQTATVLIDETPPTLGFATSQLPDDPELIRVAVADARSGPSPGRGSIGVRAAGSNAAFRPLPTTVGPGALSARWNSDDYPRGAYEFRAVGFDAAGNSAATASRLDGVPMVLRNPVKAPTRIASGFGGRRLVWQRCHRVDGGRRCHRETVRGYAARPTLRTVGYGRPLRFGGVLLDAAGRPLAGRSVAVVESFSAGSAAAERRTTVVTDREGRFEARLAPGPSRRVRARFAGTHTLTRCAGAEVGMAVRAGLRFRASTADAEIGGRPVVFAGHLLSDQAEIPRTGRPIQLEFRVPGAPWSEFRTVVTDRRGRFRYPYAFTDDDSAGIRFQFRAVSPEQAGWPYRPAASAPVAVTGH